jgi:UPF0042 nucleotide-binding protein
MRAQRAPRRSAVRREVTPARFIVVTGLSGAGKSQAIHALEDLGYFCVDNLPVALIATFAELTARGEEQRRAAVVVDIREGRQLAEFPPIYRRLKRRLSPKPQLIFLEASDASLVQRYSETRRPHPLAPNRSAAEGLREERRRLEAIRRLADHIIDTSKLSVHELRRVVQTVAGGPRALSALAVNVVSFGFKAGVPPDADLVFDVRFLPNPHFVPRLRPQSGLDRPVARFVLDAAAAKQFVRRTNSLLRFLLPQYIEEGKHYLTVAIGCTGGQHRSVAVAEALARGLRGVKGIELRVRHRDVAHRLKKRVRRGR